MRQRTGREKYAMGLLNPIFRDLAIKKGTRGYMPLMDLICYAYENPDKSFHDIIEYLDCLDTCYNTNLGAQANL